MENRLLARLAVPDFALLKPHLKQVSLPQGAILQEPDTLVEWVYFPLSGAVSLLAVMKGHEAVEIASVGRDGAIGLSAHSGPGARGAGHRHWFGSTGNGRNPRINARRQPSSGCAYRKPNTGAIAQTVWTGHARDTRPKADLPSAGFAVTHNTPNIR